ncbi:Cytochrome P450 superfamily [Arabidopsis thaliana x Arabidopsis arenosa]|uniref:Cytochrome P450 superfamily n=1 Tax=Arabidopsis thaliana x Arabidopsis arenosa TaxID=1240361 RepID=A0A8T2A846_9BRAS|nr:Cytochrome P450 superfamily [Arabidopsis thaliana x Arabidopsis arenosa]
METILMVSLCLTSLLTLFLFKQFLKRTAIKVNLPPSPWRLPVIGNLHQLSLHPHRSLHSLSLRYGPLMLLHFGRVPILVVSSGEAAHEVLKTHDLKFANRPRSKAVHGLMNGGRDVVFGPYGEYWRQMKSVCILNLLTNKMVASFEKIREEEVNAMIEKLEKASSSSSSENLSELFVTLPSDVTSRVALGRKHSEDETARDLKKRVRQIMELLGEFPIGDYVPVLAWIDRINGFNARIKEVSQGFSDLMDKVVQEHLEAGNHKEDFVDILLSIESEKSIGFQAQRNDIKFMILDMFIGGTSTSSTLLEWIMTELIRNPNVMKKLQDEIRSTIRPNGSYIKEKEVENMKYLKAVIKEVFRLHPPLPLILPRLLSEDVKVKGYNIAAGTEVIINAWAIQRDPAIWGPDAEEFKPERHLDSTLDYHGKDLNFIPFGSGRRICPGINLALGLVEVTVANLVGRFDWRVEAGPNGDQPDLAEAAGLDVCRKFPLIAFPSSVI